MLSYEGKKDNTFWSIIGNFPSLFDLVEQVNEYGSVRWYWDGTREGFIQSVKKELVVMRRSASYFKGKIVLLQKRGNTIVEEDSTNIPNKHKKTIQ